MVLFLLLSSLRGEGRANGLGEAYVSLADQPVAFYYNPAGICFLSQKVIEIFPTDIVKTPLSSSFIGYAQPVGDYGFGISFMNIVEKNPYPYISIGKKFSLFSVGATIGDGFALGTLASIGLKEIPGSISIGFSINYLEGSLRMQIGSCYKFERFNFMLEVVKKRGEPFSPLIGGFLSFEDFILPGIEIGGGWGLKGPSGLIALDFEDLKMNFSYYESYERKLGFSVLFRIGSKKGFREEVARLSKEKEKKEKETARTYIMQGISFYNDKDYENSLRAFDIALIWDPENKDALNWLERVNKEKKKMDIDFYLSKAEENMRKRDFAEAMRYAEEVLELDSTNITALKIYEDAEREFYEYIFASSSSPVKDKIYGYFKKGLNYYSKKDYEKAKKEWEKVRSIDPKNKDAQRLIEKANRAMAQRMAKRMQKLERYEKSGDYKKALSLAKRLKRLVPSNKELSQKIEFYNKKIAEKVRVLEDKGVGYYNQGMYARARKVFSDILELQPDNRIAKRYLPLVENKLKKEDADELYMAGIEAYLKGDYKKAIGLWREVLRLDPSYKKASINIKRAQEKLKHLE